MKGKLKANNPTSSEIAAITHIALAAFAISSFSCEIKPGKKNYLKRVCNLFGTFKNSIILASLSLTLFLYYRYHL